MQNGSSGRPMGVHTDYETDGQAGVSEPRSDPACLVPGTCTSGSRMRTELAAAIAEIKELYERECAGPEEAVGALERERQAQQRADNAEPGWDATRIEAVGAQVRAARAVAALASEHETRLAAEAELDRLRAEVEGERERTREAHQQAQVAGERRQRAEAEVIQLRREIEVRHHQAEHELTGLAEEANGLEQRLQAAEVEAAQLREAEVARGLFGRWPRLTATSSALLGMTVGIMSAWLRYSSPEPAPQPSGPILSAEQPRTPAVTSIQPEHGQIRTSSPVAPSYSAEQDRDERSQSKLQPTEHQEQGIPAASMQDKVPEGKSAPSTSVPGDASPPKSPTEIAQQDTQAKVGLQQLGPTPTADKVTLAPGSTRPPPSSLPTTTTVTAAVGLHIAVYYRQGSPSARADAERVATWMASSGFGGPRLLLTKRAFREQVVRYFFVEDAEAANRIVGELQKKGGAWRAEDHTHDRHKPPPGNIQVWPIRVP
jgi:hypothetical protein